MKDLDIITRLIDAKRDRFTDVADRIWDLAETRWGEHASMATQIDAIGNEGFRVEAGIAGIPTAFVAEAGHGGPVISFLGEYDALPGLSQEAGIDSPTPREIDGGRGHGCGHNLLGSGAMMAATAVKDWLAANNMKGRVRYYGCPAEEGGSSKGFMVRDGVFDDVDIAISWHPAPFAAVNNPVSLACNEIDFSFEGRAAHAASAPHLGRSALDAVELMNVGVNYMREHMPSTARIHYAMIDGGGPAPNVVQAHAVVRYLIRALDLPTLQALIARVIKVAEGAGLMTETSMKLRYTSGDANLLGNAPLEALMQANLDRLGPPRFDDADRAFARKFQATLRPENIEGAFARFGLAPDDDTPLCDRVIPLYAGDNANIGSTDVGTVSWVVPTVQMRGATYAIGTPGHSWQLVAQGKAPAAHKGMEHAAKVMAGTAIDLFSDPALVQAAKADLAKRIARTPFVNPIPDDVMPPV